MKKLAIGLYSGGLDSLLAARLVVDQGFSIILLTFLSPFFEDRRPDSTLLKKLLPASSFSIQEIEMGLEFFKMLRSPRFGYGRNVNPCIDCKIFMVSKAALLREELGGAFVFTGEVLGQRPMSQRRDTLRIIERESGLSGYLLRPLSAQFLPPTKAEEEGLIEREKLLSISGRSRKQQMALAAIFGLTNYPNPAGGCLLTDVNYSRRFRVLVDEQQGSLSGNDLDLLKIGRHFLLRPGLRLIVGRNQSENEKLIALQDQGDWVFHTPQIPGAVSLAKGSLLTEDFQRAASITARYSDGKNQAVVLIAFGSDNQLDRHFLKVSPAQDPDLLEYLI